jgi:N-methylhydantoinase A
VSERGRISIDTGGTFTDIVCELPRGVLGLHKTPTTPDDPIEGILVGLRDVARTQGESLEAFLGHIETVVHGTTRATNAVLTGTTARTAFLTTAGHPDILSFRMGGREHPFRHDREYPQPYVPRALTFEIAERIDWRGRVVRPLELDGVDAIAALLEARGVEAAGVCLLWSVVNGTHERLVGERLSARLPHLAITLSHELNPVVREYHRASAACIDASLKPLMSGYLASLRRRLGEAGFGGSLLVASVGGGLVDPAELARAPIQSLNSGPALAPVAGRHYAGAESSSRYAVVVDAGGTSFDVSVVRDDRIPRTRESWLGDRYVGHLTGFPSVDVRTTGSGGGSIARVDAGGLLVVGPESAGSVPGPACYARGGERATVTDAALVLGYLDAASLERFGIDVNASAAAAAIERDVAQPLSLGREDAASAVMRVLTEQMVHAVEEVTVEQGLDPRGAVLVSGGGAAGFNIVSIARRLGARVLVIPGPAAALSATGGLLSDPFAEFAGALHTITDAFDEDAVNSLLAALAERCREWARESGRGEEMTLELAVEARYPGQVWELELPLEIERFAGSQDVERMRQAFHRLHRAIFAVDDAQSPVEAIGWRATAKLPTPTSDLEFDLGAADVAASRRAVWCAPGEWLEIPVFAAGKLSSVAGPAIIELPGTTVFLDEDAAAVRSPAGSLIITPGISARTVAEEEAADVR